MRADAAEPTARPQVTRLGKIFLDFGEMVRYKLLTRSRLPCCMAGRSALWQPKIPSTTARPARRGSSPAADGGPPDITWEPARPRPPREHDFELPPPRAVWAGPPF